MTELAAPRGFCQSDTAGRQSPPPPHAFSATFATPTDKKDRATIFALSAINRRIGRLCPAELMALNDFHRHGISIMLFRDEMMRYLPVGLNLRGKPCVVVGGGRVGTRKSQSLLRAGALLTVVSPTVTDELSGDIKAGRIRWVNECYRDEHLAGAALVVAATDDRSVNSAVAENASGLGALACNASSAEHSQIIFGALLDLDDAIVAVFTNGRNPADSVSKRDQIAKLIREDTNQ